MVSVRRSILGLVAVAAVGTVATAQPPPGQPQQPPANPTTTPPPETPTENWAPPLQEPPPREAEGAPANEREMTSDPTTSGASTTATSAEGDKEDDGTTLEIYGHAMLDSGFDFGKIGDPNWQDVLRPTKLPAFRNEFGTGPRTFLSVRQTRFGVKSTTPTSVGEVKSQFEFELFGVGVDEGQTTFRLRHAYGDWKGLRAGQTWSPFMDIDVFPNSIEYWGPNGMVFFRNVQLAYMPVRGEYSRVTVALERPGASPDTGIYTGRVEIENVVSRFPAPDVSGEARFGGPWGYVEVAGIVRWIEWDDLDPTLPRVDGSAFGWGVNLSSNVKLGPALLRLQGVYGRAIENYMNDAGADIGPRMTGNPDEPVKGVSLPVLGLVGFVDMEWSKYLTSSAGWSMVWIDNSEDQTPDAFHVGHYALGNLLVHPTDRLMFGGEFQFGRRENNSDGFDVNDFRIQFSVKYAWSKTFGGE